MRSNLKKIAKLILKLVAALLIVYTAYSIYGAWGELSDVDMHAPQLIFILVALTIFNLAAIGRLFDGALNSFGLNLGYMESTRLAALTRFANYVSFGQVGFAIRAYYLRQQHNFAIRKSLSMTGLTTLLFYMANALFLIGVSPFIELGTEQKDKLYVVLFIILFIIFSLLLLSLPRIHKSIWFIDKFIKNHFEGWSIHFLSKSFGWAVLAVVSSIYMTQLELAVFGVGITFYEAAFISAFRSLSAIFNITPAGIGVNEGILLLAGSSLGLPKEVLLLSALLRRVVVFGVASIISLEASRSIFNSSLLGLMRGKLK